MGSTNTDFTIQIIAKYNRYRRQTYSFSDGSVSYLRL